MNVSCVREQLPRFPGTARKNDALFLYGAVRKKPYIHTYVQSSTEIVHGPSCKKEHELCMDTLRTDNIPVVARRGGGGTVVLAAGMVVTVIVGHRRGNEGALQIFERIHDAMRTSMAQWNITLEKKGISDLAIRGKKVLGSSLYLQRSPAHYYYQSSLIVYPAQEAMQRYLGHPPREPEYRRHRSHRDFCTSLHEEGYIVSPESICSAFLTLRGI